LHKKPIRIYLLLTNTQTKDFIYFLLAHWVSDQITIRKEILT